MEKGCIPNLEIVWIYKILKLFYVAVKSIPTQRYPKKNEFLMKKIFIQKHLRDFIKNCQYLTIASIFSVLILQKSSIACPKDGDGLNNLNLIKYFIIGFLLAIMKNIVFLSR